MEDVQIINTKTREEAYRDYDEFMAHATHNNKMCTIWIIILSIAFLFSIWAIETWVNSEIQLIVGFIAFAVAAAAAAILSERWEHTEICHWPSCYRYHKILEEYKILKTEVLWKNDEHYVCFTVADVNDEVTHQCIYDFTKVTKVGIDKTTVDIESRKILEPYIA